MLTLASCFTLSHPHASAPPQLLSLATTYANARCLHVILNFKWPIVSDERQANRQNGACKIQLPHFFLPSRALIRIHNDVGRLCEYVFLYKSKRNEADRLTLANLDIAHLLWIRLRFFLPLIQRRRLVHQLFDGYISRAPATIDIHHRAQLYYYYFFAHLTDAVTANWRCTRRWNNNNKSK